MRLLIHRAIVALLAFINVAVWVNGAVAADIGSAHRYEWSVVEVLPHQETHFTQGLVLVGTRLYESTGKVGQSSVVELSPQTGEVLRRYALAPSWFGEGLTAWNNQLFVLTWTEQVAQVLDLELRPLQQMRYTGEGWGLTTDGATLIMSNGSSTLTFRDPETFAAVGQVKVRDGDVAVTQLNELEYVKGKVLANVWHQRRIAVIDPPSGHVTGWIDLHALDQEVRTEGGLGCAPAEAVLNGIAFDRKKGLLYVTGKCWPKMYVLDIPAFRRPE